MSEYQATSENPFQGHFRGAAYTHFSQVFEKIGGPGGTRTPNQTVMSGGSQSYLIDNNRYSVK